MSSGRKPRSRTRNAVIPEFFEEKYPGTITLAFEVILICCGYGPRVFARGDDKAGYRPTPV